MMDSRHDEEENMVALYEASRNGCVSILNTFIQRDARILDRVSLTSFIETPLHIAALHGHFEFSRLLINKKPKLAEEVDSLGRTPLHLASAEGHTEIVKALLEAHTDVCLAFDQDEKIPLHLAAMRGRIEVIKELIIARRESIWVNLNGDNVLHLCVRYNHLDALKLLVELANGEELFLCSKDHNGNSILHLAVMLKQMKAIKYLLSIPEIKRKANAMNMIGYTALDVLEVCPRDFKGFEIKNILKEAGFRRSIDLNSSLQLTSSGIGVDEAQPMQFEQPAQSRFRRWWEYVCSSLVKHLKYQGNWFEETRGTLMLVATVMATMAFQAGISPPGGVWQENTTTGNIACTIRTNGCQVGKAVLSYTYPSDYLFFLYLNTTSFFASLCVILLVISGFPLKSNFFMWFFTLAMASSVVSMTLTYFQAMFLVTPIDFFDGLNSLDDIFQSILIGVLTIVSLIYIIRPLSWMVKKLRNFIRKSKMGPTENPINV